MNAKMREPTRTARKKCAGWLKACLDIGWKKSDLDFLELLWWKYHDDHGQLAALSTPALTPQEKDLTRVNGVPGSKHGEKNNAAG